MKTKIFMLAAIVLGTAAAAVRAEEVQPSAAAVTVDGKASEAAMYNIYGNNYLMLRDAARLLSGTGKQFNVEWDDYHKTVVITCGAEYREEDVPAVARPGEAQCSVPDIKAVNGEEEITRRLVGYNINGNNYYKIRDIAGILDFGVEYVNGSVCISTSEMYKPQEPVQPPGELIGMAYEAALPLFIDEVPVVSYYSTCDTAYDEEQQRRISSEYRLNGAYIDVKGLENYGFDVEESGGEIRLVHRKDKTLVQLETAVINSAPYASCAVYGAGKQVFLEGEPVRSIETGETSLISACELMRYCEPEERTHINAFEQEYDYRINFDMQNYELNKAYDSAAEEPVKESEMFLGWSMFVSFKPSVGIGKITHLEDGVKSQYIGGCDGLDRNGIGIYRKVYNPTGGAGLAPTRYISFMRGEFEKDQFLSGICYKQITNLGYDGGMRVEGDMNDGYQRRSVVMQDFKDYLHLDQKHFRFGLRVVCEGEVRDGSFCGAYKAYGEDGALVYEGDYEAYKAEHPEECEDSDNRVSRR